MPRENATPNVTNSFLAVSDKVAKLWGNKEIYHLHI